LNLAYDSVEFRPKPAAIEFSLTLAGVADGLAGEAAADEVNGRKATAA
jgi:hypothetical protein